MKRKDNARFARYKINYVFFKKNFKITKQNLIISSLKKQIRLVITKDNLSIRKRLQKCHSPMCKEEEKK